MAHGTDIYCSTGHDQIEPKAHYGMQPENEVLTGPARMGANAAGLNRDFSNGSRPTLIRARSEHFHQYSESSASRDDDDGFQLRHGWQDEYTSSEYLRVLTSVRTRFIKIKFFLANR